MTVGSGTLTVKNGKYKELAIVDAEGKEYTTIIGGVVVNNSTSSPYTAASGVEFIDATSRTTTVQITGNELNNTILGGSDNDTLYGENGADSLLGGAGADKLYGGAGDDILIGGAGNDSLWGNDGANTFVYNAGDGKDLITGFGENDSLIINDVDLDDIAISKTSTALVMNIDTNNTITFKKYVTDTFNINGSAYEVKGNVLVKQED